MKTELISKESKRKLALMKILFPILGILILVGGFLFIFKPTAQNSPEKQPQSELEVFLSKNNASLEVAEAYKFAQENPQNVLSVVRCYCGCLTNGSGHKNNRDCFFNEDGSIDLMGLNCGLCIKTALVSKQMLAEGKTVGEISSYVDTRWGKDN